MQDQPQQETEHDTYDRPDANTAHHRVHTSLGGSHQRV
jgi:hypothetical protein